MTKKDMLFEKAFSTLQQEGSLTEQQKETMLKQILMEGKSENIPVYSKLKRMVVVCPWRFALIVSAVQAVVFTMILGKWYTNLFLNFFGG